MLFLKQQGHHADIINWRDKEINLLAYDGIFVSSTWDIPSKSLEFKSWLNACEQDKEQRLINSKEVLEFGLHKDTYYDFLTKDQSIAKHLIPTYFIKQKTSFNDAIKETDRNNTYKNKNLVLKPIISADGYQTMIFCTNHTVQNAHTLSSFDSAKKIYDAILNDHKLRGVMIQPYLSGIEDGEYSITFIDAEPILCIKKPGGFRNDKSIHRIPIDLNKTPQHILKLAKDTATALLKKYSAQQTTRFRVDIIEQDGFPYLAELELVEPNCNFGVINNNKDHTYKPEDLINALGNAIIKTTATLRSKK